MIAHQRLIREKYADGHPVPPDMTSASVREISREEAKTVILRYEWLGNMGNSSRYFGLFFGPELAGVNCFGHPESTEILNICGEEHADKVFWLARGACVHWAHPHSGSFLTTEACKRFGVPWKTRDGKDMPPKFIFLATADTDAGEMGTIYQSCNWVYVGQTAAPLVCLKDGMPMEKARSYRVLVKAPLRNRTNRVETPDSDGRRHFLIDGQRYYFGDTLPSGEFIAGSPKYPFRLRPEYGHTMKEAEKARWKELEKEGWRKVTGNRKHMYVGVFGDKRMRRTLFAALRKNKTQAAYPHRPGWKKAEKQQVAD